MQNMTAPKKVHATKCECLSMCITNGLSYLKGLVRR